MLIQCCFTSTGTMRFIRDGDPRPAISTFTQLLSFVIIVNMVLNVHRNHKAH